MIGIPATNLGITSAGITPDEQKPGASPSQEQNLHLNVGGERFVAPLSTLRKYPETNMAALFASPEKIQQDKIGSLWIPRDGLFFGCILNFLRDPNQCRVDFTGASLNDFKEECKYYGLLEIMFPAFESSFPMIFQDPNGNYISATQDQDTLWYINQVPVRVCQHCDYAEYQPELPHHPHTCLHFRRLVYEHGGMITDAQPSLHRECRVCPIKEMSS